MSIPSCFCLITPVAGHLLVERQSPKNGREKKKIELMTESKKEKMEVYCLNLAPVNLSRLYYIRRSRSRPPKKSMEAMTDFVNGAAGAKLRISIFLTEHRITLLAESECRFYQQGNHRHSSEKTNKYSWA